MCGAGLYISPSVIFRGCTVQTVAAAAAAAAFGPRGAAQSGNAPGRVVSRGQIGPNEQ